MLHTSAEMFYVWMVLMACFYSEHLKAFVCEAGDRPWNWRDDFFTALAFTFWPVTIVIGAIVLWRNRK